MATFDPYRTMAITHVENFDQWFTRYDCSSTRHGVVVQTLILRDVLPFTKSSQGYKFTTAVDPQLVENDYDSLAAIRFLYHKKIGQVGCFWSEPNIPIEYKYAKVKFGDIFEYFTSPNGVLRLPDWHSMKYAVDEFLEAGKVH